MVLRVTADHPQFIFDDTTGRRIGLRQPNGDIDYFSVTNQEQPAPRTLDRGAQGLWRVIGASAVAVSITGTLVETTLATVIVPAGILGPNGRLRVSSVWSVTPSVNSKTWQVKYGGVAISGRGETSAGVNGFSDQKLMSNRNSQSSQVAVRASTTGPFGQLITTPAITTLSIDASAAQNLTFTGTLANTGETITLEDYLVEALYMP